MEYTHNLLVTIGRSNSDPVMTAILQIVTPQATPYSFADIADQNLLAKRISHLVSSTTYSNENMPVCFSSEGAIQSSPYCYILGVGDNSDIPPGWNKLALNYVGSGCVGTVFDSVF